MEITRWGESRMQPHEKAEIIQSLPQNALYLEIGSLAGASTAEFLSARPDITAVCVDPLADGGFGNGEISDAIRLQLLQNCREFPTRMNAWIGTAESLSRICALNLFDVTLVDGDHSEDFCYQDLEWALGLTKANGLIVVHDYHSELESLGGVRRATDRFIEKHHWGVIKNVGLSAFLKLQKIEDSA